LDNFRSNFIGDGRVGLVQTCVDGVMLDVLLKGLWND